MTFYKIILTLIFLLIFSNFTLAGVRWEGKIPPAGKDSAKWHQLIDELLKHQLYYGALAASYRSLMFFEDIITKEKAYKTITILIDRGYPFSTKQLFETGDIDPHLDYELVNAYNLYKAIVNQEKKMNRWAQFFMDKTDKEKYPKYKFFQALEEYGKKNLDVATKMLSELLTGQFKMEQVSFATKIARTLARIYFEQEKYDRALDIYETFLIKQNPVVPTDWLETAWCHYYLKNYDKALGYLYNLESKVASNPVVLEKYILRAAIYMDVCATDSVESLIKEFTTNFGTEINGIIKGKTLTNLNTLRQIYLPKHQEFFQANMTIDRLRKEFPLLSSIDGTLLLLAEYLYKSELAMQTTAIKFYEEDAINAAANELIMLSESLKFLKYGTAREKFNPSNVFKEKDSRMLGEEIENNDFILRWSQAGDFWRDERYKYKGIFKSQCD
ncbi:MAG: hypothetical protein A2451_08360 [Bdellovibrionales bacterium RIFOXYC2_FULL_39_8]|nr:MAG: hypothetical protein A2451_08360 [Bdellovibrionales bacterium RIFOXYC2_FULL_39_8]